MSWREIGHFSVQGPPIAQPRTKWDSRNGRMYTPGAVDSWKTAVQAQANYSITERGLECPIKTHMIFLLERPKSHYVGSGRKNGAKLRQDAPTYHTGTPDKDNLEKAVLDVLKNLGVYKDDAQVAEGSVTKMYADGDEPQGVWVFISRWEDRGR